MSLGGSKQQQQPATSTVVNETSLPAYAQPYYTDLMSKAQQVANTPYQAYNGPRIAGFNPTQTQAFDLAGSLPGKLQPAIDQAGGLNTLAAQRISQPTQNWVDPGVSQKYMNPFLDQYNQNVIQNANQQFAEQGVARLGQQAKTGSFGGDRRFVQDSLAQRDQNNQLSTLLSQGNMQAYQQGLGAFQSDRDANLQQTMGIGSLSKNIMDSAATGNNAYLQDVAALNDSGKQQQQHTQASLDQAYQDFVNQRDYNRNNITWEGGILNGVPVSPSSSASNYENPNGYSQLLGLGVNALALNKALA